MSPIIFHIDADAFFAAVEQAFNPQLRGKPVIVGGSETQRGVVHTASYEARALNIKTGMPLAEAKRICPQAIFLKGNYQHYKAVSQKLQEIYLRYTPIVEFTSIGDAYLDMCGTGHLYPDMEATARQIQAAVTSELGISVSIGIGKNKLIARIASDMNKPGGLTCIAPGSEIAFLHQLPVAEIPGIGRMTREKLAEFGIYTVGQLAKLPKLALNELFGLNGLKMWHFARGEDSREVKERILPKQISRETTFEEDLTDKSVILATLRYLIERIAAKLREGAQLCRQIQVKIRYSDFSRHQKSRVIKQPTDSAADIFSAAEEITGQISFRRIRVRHVGIQVSRLEWNDWQLQFFDDARKWEILDGIIDDIRNRYGFTAILPADTLQLQSKYRMEKSGFILHSPALTK